MEVVSKAVALRVTASPSDGNKNMGLIFFQIMNNFLTFLSNYQKNGISKLPLKAENAQNCKIQVEFFERFDLKSNND
jgi:hypothetical protein